jgi:DegV family protein with EDD domain
MSNVAIVTDSTINLPQSFNDQYQITVLPLTLIWDGAVYLDGIDIQPAEFYARLAQSKTNPTTSQATPAQFSQVYADLLAQGKEILSIHISSKLSGTIASAIQAKEMFPGAKIEVVDSLSTSMGTGLLVLAAARAIQNGASLKEARELVYRLLPNSGVFFVVDTLTYLHRGGRIGGAARFLGTALDLKPILMLREGRIEAVERVRSQRRAFERLVEIVAQKVGEKRPVRIAGLYTDIAEQAHQVISRLAEKVDPIETMITDVSPVIGNHTGPGTVGIGYLIGE